MLDRSEVTALLEDAKLMVGYAARTGRLKDGALLDTIEEVAEKLAKGESHQEAELRLVKQMNALAGEIAPITILDLGSRWKPFPAQRFDQFVRPLFAAIALSLVVAVASLTFLYSQATTAVQALSDVQSQDFMARSEHLYIQAVRLNLPAKYSEALLKSGGDADDYMKEYDDLRRLQDKLTLYTSTATRLNTYPIVKFVQGAVFYPSVPATDPSVLAAKPGYGEYKPPQAGVQTANPAPVLPDPPVGEYYVSMSNYLTSVGISVSPPGGQLSIDDQVANGLRTSSDIVLILGSWVLPALYGLLGAMVFQLRLIMNPMLPNPHLGSVVVRSALAMMAGVSIAWLAGSLEIQKLSPGLAVFGLAFMFGFSIDIFFATLDKLVNSISKAIVARG